VLSLNNAECSLSKSPSQSTLKFFHRYNSLEHQALGLKKPGIPHSSSLDRIYVQTSRPRGSSRQACQHSYFDQFFENLAPRKQMENSQGSLDRVTRGSQKGSSITVTKSFLMQCYGGCGQKFLKLMIFNIAEVDAQGLNKFKVQLLFNSS
jgi:hypothetical protein